MLDFLHTIAGTVERMSSTTDYLTLPGKASDYAFIRINKSDELAHVRLASRTGQDRKKIYAPNNHSALFFGKEFLDADGAPNLEKIETAFARTKKAMASLSPHLPAQGSHRQLADRMARIARGLKSFAEELAQAVISQKPEADLAKMAFYFDHAERSVFDNEQVALLNDAIQKSSLASGEGDEITDCFGVQGRRRATPFSSGNVARVGLISCYTRDEATPANSIYGRSGVDCCPLTETSSDRLLRTFKAVTEGELAKHVFSVSPAGMTIVCPTGFAESTPEVIEVNDDILRMTGLAFEQIETTPVEGKETFSFNDFVSSSEKVVQALRGLLVTESARGHLDAAFHMLVCKKHPSSKTIIVQETLACSADHLIEQTEKWATAVRNPDVPRPWRKPVRIGEFDIKPARIERLINTRWSRNAGLTGDKASHVEEDTSSARVTLGDCLRLYLFDDKQVAGRIVHLISTYHVNLMLDVGHRRIARAFDRSVNLGVFGRRADVQQLPSLLSVCLTKLGVDMTDVQTDPAFLMGRLCGLFSKAQQVYHARNSRLASSSQPKRLIGETFSAAIMSGINPKGKFAELERRGRSFADFVRKQAQRSSDQGAGEKTDPVVILHRRILKNIRLLSEGGGVPPTFSADQKCNFGLGYLSA